MRETVGSGGSGRVGSAHRFFRTEEGKRKERTAPDAAASGGSFPL